MSDNLVEATQIAKTFPTSRGPFAALQDVSMCARPGEFVSLIGASGCGKSTLLRVIAGVLRPSGGEVRIADEPVTEPRDDVSLVFQQPALLAWRSVLDNVFLPVDVAGQPRKRYRDDAHRLLELMGLTRVAKQWPWQLSGGMQQRVAIARALLLKPSLLLMDEPFGALDAITRDRLGVELLRIWSEFKMTIVFVTHSIAEAALLSDRVLVMRASPGRVSEEIEIDFRRPRVPNDIYDPYLVERQAQLRSAIEVATSA